MTGVTMDKGEGERLERQRRRKFWSVIGVLLLTGAVTGFFAGLAGSQRDATPDAIFEALPAGVVIGFLAFAIATFTYGCWAFVKAIDEVELTDNLWGSTASYYAYAVLFPSWWVLGQAGLAPQPNHWAIFLASLAAGLAVYGYRKWRAR